MRKFILLFLIIANVLTAQEVIFLNSGKRVQLNEDFTWQYLEIEVSEGFDFRKTNWGMTMEDVKKSEVFSEYGNPSDGILMYKGSVSDLDCAVVYFFTNNLLTSARYFFTETHSNDNDFLTDYSLMKDLLTKKYGEPKEDEAWWRNDLYKDDYSHWGFAVSLGHYIKYATWENEKTSVEISLTGDNYSVTHKIDYSSVELKKLKSSTAVESRFKIA